MNSMQKFRETAASVIPIMVIVLILNFTAAPLGTELVTRFLIGGVLLIVGLTFFLTGVDIGILPIGERSGSVLTQKRNLLLLLSVSLVIGFLVTIAEPDIQVFSEQVRSIYPSVNKRLFIVMIAAGVGLYIMIGLLRTILQVPLKIILFVSYIVIFIIVFMEPEGLTGIAFDSGGATTGPLTVPFILSLGVGVSAVRSRNTPGHRDDSQSDSFGLTGLASVGPVLAVLLYGIIFPEHTVTAVTGADAVTGTGASGPVIFIRILPLLIRESVTSLAPLVLLFLVFQLFLLKMPPYQVIRIMTGLVYSFIGLTVFLVGVNGGFMPVGRRLGLLLGEKIAFEGGWWTVLLIGTGMLLGAVVVCAEPAVWVLTEQVESISGGTIKRKMMLLFLSAGSAVAIGLAMWRAVSGFDLKYILVPGYALAFLLMLFCPKLFTGIAFDSGGVASGPISSTFILSFTLGVSQAAGTHTDAFGVISLIAMTPLIAIQLLGLEYSQKRKNI
jgi:hypothetical protein